MGEEEEEEKVSNSNKTESQPQFLAPVPEEPSLVLEKDSEKPDTPNPIDVNQEQKATSPIDQNDVSEHDGHKETEGGDGKKDTGEDSIDRDASLARVVSEKRLALIKAWEESEKTKAENRAYKNHSAVGLWEESKKASIEAQIKKIEENLEKKKAEYVEKMKNKMAEIHQYAEEKRAIVEAQKREEFIELEETAAKFRSRGVAPKKLFACFSA